MKIRQGSEGDDTLLVQHHLAIWESYGTQPDHFSADAEDHIRSFIREGRARLGLATFVAEVEGEVAGSAACQLHVSPYPSVIRTELRKFGYIWHVFVLPEFGRRGIGRALTLCTIDHLKDLGCTSAVLNASEAGEALYAALGFERAMEMRLKL